MNFIVEVENTSKSPVDRGWIAFPPQSTSTVLVPDYSMKALKSAAALKLKIISIENPPQAPVSPTPEVQKVVPKFEPKPAIPKYIPPVTQDDEPEVAPVEAIDASSEYVEETPENRQVVNKRKQRGR